jgi:hypothetical protein
LFFTAQNVCKGNVGMITYYGGRDRGNDLLVDDVNLRLPGGYLLDWGNAEAGAGQSIGTGSSIPAHCQ